MDSQHQEQEPLTVQGVVKAQEVEAAERVNVFRDCVDANSNTVMIHTEGQASQVAWLLNKAQRELEDVQAIAEAMVRRAESRVKGLEFLFMQPLEIWTSAQVAGKKARSLILEGGKLSLRKVPRSVKTVDNEMLLEWAKKESLVEMVPKVKLDAVKAWEESTGEAAPGRTVTPEHDSFSVSVPKPR